MFRQLNKRTIVSTGIEIWSNFQWQFHKIHNGFAGERILIHLCEQNFVLYGIGEEQHLSHYQKTMRSAQASKMFCITFILNKFSLCSLTEIIKISLWF